jgi:hypothetical protein
MRYLDAEILFNIVDQLRKKLHEIVLQGIIILFQGMHGEPGFIWKCGTLAEGIQNMPDTAFCLI